LGRWKDRVWFHKSKETTGIRCWLHWGEAVWHYEGYTFKNANKLGISMDVGGDENDISLGVGIKGLFTMYFGVDGLLPRKWKYKHLPDTRNYGISAFDDYISIEFHRDDYGYGKGWRGFHKMINWKDILFGKAKYTEEEIHTMRGYVRMPEGDYAATIRAYNATWTRKRFVDPMTITRYEITPDTPIPEPGKGENGWDQEDDATFCTTIRADSVSDALFRMAQSIMRTRENREGKNWVPDAGFSDKLNQPL